MSLLRRLQDADRRLGLDPYANEANGRHLVRWWKWYLTGALAVLVVVIALVVVGLIQLGLVVIGPAGVLGLNALMGWKIQRQGQR